MSNRGSNPLSQVCLFVYLASKESLMVKMIHKHLIPTWLFVCFVCLFGSLGAPGVPGPPGLNGIPGDIKNCPPRQMSAFAVKLTEPFPAPSQPIVFNETLHNHQGHFNLTTGVFTCVIRGLYHFGYHVETFQRAASVGLMRNGTQVSQGEAEAEGGYGHLSGTALLELGQGDKVWLESKRSQAELEEGTIQTVFWGVLLHAKLPPSSRGSNFEDTIFLSGTL
uniref:C1q domain-containing protein n=1 Tax=Sus scrofa TaxID=9823 RepID=A0A8D2BFX4_PIG